LQLALKHAIWTVQANQERLKFSGTHHLLVCADINILGESTHTMNKNTETFSVCSKEIGPKVNAEKSKYKIMSCEQNAGQSHNIKIDNSSFERVEDFKYLGAT
jgi:hypothetical protein